jgi:hypothetical protein
MAPSLVEPNIVRVGLEGKPKPKQNHKNTTHTHNNLKKTQIDVLAMRAAAFDAVLSFASAYLFSLSEGKKSKRRVRSLWLWARGGFGRRYRNQQTHQNTHKQPTHN